ncbi:tudor domain-containing protein 5 isoform X2 [Diachasma alloeum]|uniref:tudor domain-containing protein 5 isoform X2 n=1 Tax=Diachasma alloeum TaxID=454923 RepID=UPI000738261E|nr:tudor domain-containing protein 5 isoform X2 [Diachasma alloeum]
MAGSNARCREEVVRTIVSLLVTEKPAYNIPIPKLESLYRSSECERIPYRVLGYPSVVEFLRTIPQIQIVTRDGTNLINFLGSEKTRDLSELVARQRTSQKSQRSRSTCRGRGPRGIPQGYFPRSQSAFPPRTSDTFSRLCTETLEILERSQGGLSRTNLMYKVREKKLGYFDMQNLNDILLHLGGKVVVSDQMVFAAARARHNEISWEGDRREPPRPQNPVVVRNFQVEEEDDYFGDFEEHQAPAKDEKPLAITSGPQGEDPAKEDPMPGVNDPRTQAEVEMIINERMRFRLEKLIQNRPEGIWCAELAKIYHEVYNLTLEWQQLGFNSLSDLVLHLPDIFYCVQPSPTGDFRVFDAKNKDKGTVMPVKMTLSAIHQIYPDPEDDVRAVPAGLSPETINRLIPEDVVRLGETIGQVLIDCFNQEDKGYEEVVVCDAFTPSFFWIHLRRKILKLDTMMERLQEYYEQKGSTYNVPLIVLEKGLNVVCKFYGKWHRGIVKTVEPDAESTTTVLFYDYGTLHKYPATAMHFLHRKFSNLPAQAIPCGLYNIKPPEDYGALKNPDGKVRWSIETSRRFVQRVHDRPLVAICGKKFPENNSMLLSLTDTSSDEDVNIGEWLVNDGLAVHGSMGLKIDPNDLNQYTEDYDWERTEEAPERPQAAPGNEGNNPIIQNLVVKGVIASTRLAERGAQLMGAIDSLISLNFKEVDVSMVDVQSLLSLKKTILEDWEEFCPEKPKRSWKFLFGQKSQNASEDGTVTVNGVDQSFSSTRDVACGPLGSEEGLGGLQESLRTSQDSSEACRTVEGQGDQGTLEPLEENDVEDLGSFHSGSSIRILDECDESMYSAFDLPDTNPFKNDLMSATTCPFPENNEQKAPPPIPPRTKRHSSISNLSRIGDDTLPEVNNNVTQCLNTSDIEAWRNGNYLSAQQNGNCSSPGDQQPSEGSRRLSVPPGFRPIVPPRTLRRDINRNLTEGSELNSSNSILAVSSDTQGSGSVKRPDCLQVDLSRCSVSIFFMDGAGWITIDQFRQALTNFTDSLPIRKILVERQDETCFRVIRREENPRMFEIIRRKGRGGEQHSETEMNAFYLVPVNIVLCKMLRAFGLVSQEDLKRYTANYGVTDHPVLQELSLIFGACKEVVRCMNR